MLAPKGLASVIVLTTVLTLLCSVSAAESPRTTSMSLSEAIDASRGNNKSRVAANHRIEEARGDLRQAGVLLVENPELALEAGPRFAPSGEVGVEFAVGLEQNFALGRRTHRVDVAQAKADSAAASADDVQRVLDHAVAVAFYILLASQERQLLVERNEQLARELFTVAKRRLEAGAGTPLHLNTARVRLAEAQRKTVHARGAQRVATVRLAELAGLPPDTRLTAVGDLPDVGSAEPVEQILAEQSSTRPDLVAAASEVDAASAAIALADARAWPELGLGASYGRDDNVSILLGTLRLSLPLFNRNQGARDAARARQARVSAEYEALSIAAGAEVRRALLEYDEAREAVGIYDTAVVRAQQESLQLLTRALEVGEVGIAEVIIMQREIAVGNQGYLEARLALARARAGLRAAAGLPQTKHTKGDTP